MSRGVVAAAALAAALTGCGEEGADRGEGRGGGRAAQLGDALRGAAPGPDNDGAGSSSPGGGVVEGGRFDPQPFDGGTYTWSSGVTMRTSVELVEKWGKVDDFCGDGSCGVANRDDTRFVFRYEVTVPDTLRKPLEGYSCPGELHVAAGNDQEALSGVYGDYERSIGDTILPGATKFGVAEYYIERDYVDGEFYLESSCGDPTYSGETAFFNGPIAQN